MPLLRVFCWALIFILRLRFPPGSSISSILKKHHLCASCTGFRLNFEFEVLLIVFKAINGVAPVYFKELLTIKTSRYNLRSPDGISLVIPPIRSIVTLGDGAFEVFDHFMEIAHHK